MRKFVYSALFLFIAVFVSSTVFADSRFSSLYPCSDAGRVCTSKGDVREIDGFEVSRDCWEWSYSKTCSYPSHDDCKIYSHCYQVENVGCLLHDSQGGCVNMKKEFSCKSWQVVNKENKTARTGFEEKEGQEGLVCKGVPCIDGNCFDKSYMTNGEMMDALSKLSMIKEMKPDGQQNFNLFAGNNNHCSKKATGYSNCCQEAGKGWGSQVGSHCKPHEQELAKERRENKCIYVGKENKGKMNIVVKHHYCCFPTLLDKVVQVEARKQLGRSWGSSGYPDCRGLTLDEIQRLDFSRMDFSEFIDDLKLKFAGKRKLPDSKELAGTIGGSISSIRKYDDNPSNPENNQTGWNMNIKDDSWEAAEERRLSEEREKARLAKLEQDRLAKLEAERLEKERLAGLERKRLAERRRRFQQEYEKQQLICTQASQELDRAIAYWNSTGHKLYPGGSAGYNNEWDKVRKVQEYREQRLSELRAIAEKCKGGY